MDRSRTDQILKDLAKRAVLLTGPRQVGKTWLARRIMEEFQTPLYLNYDAIDDRRVIADRSWLPTIDFLVLDELHKMPDWKNYLKGLIDTRPRNLPILVTGSVRREWYQSAGDSLGGRFFAHRLMPFTPAEIARIPHEELGTESGLIAERLVRRGGFPEPLLARSDQDADRWRMQYVQSSVLFDSLELSAIRERRAFLTTFELLRRRVGSPVSLSSIAEDAHVSVPTVTRFVEILEALYILFRVVPFSRNIGRSLIREPKLYFFDSGLVEGSEGARFENAVAVALYAHVQHLRDVEGKEGSLCYLRTRDRHEVDFAVAVGDEAQLMLEAKTGGETPHPGLRSFSGSLPARAVQLVRTLRQERVEQKIELRRPWSFLAQLSG